MWTTVYMAQSKEKADNLRDMLEQQNIIVMLRRIKHDDSVSDNCYEILVPDAELEQALDIIIED